MCRLLAAASLLLLGLAGCDLFRPPVTLAPRYVVGAPYLANGIWRYPRESFEYADTGLATVYDGKPGLTAEASQSFGIGSKLAGALVSLSNFAATWQRSPPVPSFQSASR